MVGSTGEAVRFRRPRWERLVVKPQGPGVGLIYARGYKRDVRLGGDGSAPRRQRRESLPRERNHGGIRRKSRGRAWPHSSAGGARVLGGGGAGPFCLARLSGPLGQAAGIAVWRLFVAPRTQAKEQLVSGV